MKLGRLAIFTLLSCALLLHGCSDSDSEVSTSSSGGGSSPAPGTVTTPTNGSTPTAPVSQYAGTYKGTATATATALVLTETETAPVTIIIDNNGKVTVQSGSDIFRNVTTLSGNTFRYTQNLNGEDLGSVTCTGSVSINGNVGGGVINGRLSSNNVVCNGIPVTATGSLTATRQ